MSLQLETGWTDRQIEEEVRYKTLVRMAILTRYREQAAKIAGRREG